MKKLIAIAVLIAILTPLGFLVVGYQPTMYLMPTPEILANDRFNPFDLNSDKTKNNEVHLFYATNRELDISSELEVFSIYPGDTLHLGTVSMAIGEGRASWEDLLQFSTSQDERDKRLPIEIVEFNELDAKSPVGSILDQKPEASKFTDAINSYLQQSVDKNITIYLHGANTGAYRAVAQAAQYHHFSGQNSLVIAYVWPSAENLFAISKDQKHALETAPVFADFVEYLARNTDARRINILSYSAGAQVLGPAMQILGQRTPPGNRDLHRLGEVYFAAADIDSDVFVDQLMSYADLPERTSLAANLNDSVLGLAARKNKVSRAGSPDADDLSVDEHALVQTLSQTGKLALIKVSEKYLDGMSPRAHDFWFSHPWVSSDVLVSFSFHLQPADRGLSSKHWENDTRYWTFPPDYPQRIDEILQNVVAQH